MRIAFTLGAATKASLALLASLVALSAGGAAADAAESPRVPEEVAAYFAADLIPRLADLYGPGVDGESGIDFDESAVVGQITRVMVFTDDYRSGADTDLAVELSNNWVAPITSEPEPASDGAEPEVVQLGLATVWISPYTNVPELANFVPSDTLGAALAAAPEDSMLVHDEQADAWYALAGDQLTPLAQAGTAVSGSPLSLTEAQQTLWAQLETLPQPRANSGFVIAGLTLAFVVVLLAIFVLVPDRRRSVIDPEVALGFAPSPVSTAPRR
ncbi:MAG TPA: hypothetical protein VFT01_00750 [Homoserinimonas sp.]|nr:hypothetical protein [Homoserinimonas sp.]